MRLRLEALEDRTLLSLSAGNPQTILPLDAPKPASSIAAVASYVHSMLDQWGQWAATVQQDVAGLYEALGQEIAQGVSFVEQQWAALFGFNPNAQSATNNAMPSASSANGTADGQNKSSTASGGSSTGHSASTIVTPHAPSPSSRVTPMSSPPALPPQEYVYLSSSSYTVNENAGSVAVQVNLLTATSNTVSVELTTGNGTATVGIDYSSVDTQVVFQPGTTSQTVTIPILDDGSGDDSVASESFIVQLSNAVGAPILQPSSSTVTIQENSNSPPPPPPPPQGLVSGTVWLDNDADGIMQAGEPGMQGVLVALYLWNSVYDEWATTDANGYYQFSVPSTITSGQFQVQVLSPWGYEPTVEGASSTGIVSEVDSTGCSNLFYLNANGEAEIDAGLVALQQPTDTLQWNPGAGSDNHASTVTNWYDVKIGRQLLPSDPGPGASTPIQFDANPNDTPNSNEPITWDQNFTVASIALNQYTGQQTIPPVTTVTSSNGISMDGSSNLKVQFWSSSSKLVSAGGNATWTSFKFTVVPGGSAGEVDVTGGDVYAGGGPGTETTQVPIKLLGGNMTLQPSIFGWTPVVFQKGADMVVDNGSTLTLDDNGETGVIFMGGDGNQGVGQDGEVLYVDPQGTVVFNGDVQGDGTGDSDTVGMPVDNQGDFYLFGTPPAPSAAPPTLTIEGGDDSTADVSFYMNGASGSASTYLSGSVNLNCLQGYVQAYSSYLVDGDSNSESVSTVNNGISIGSGTYVKFTHNSSSFGTLNLDSNVSMFGTLLVNIDGANSNNNDLLKVVGVMTWQPSSKISVSIYNFQLVTGNWGIINAEGITGRLTGMNNITVTPSTLTLDSAQWAAGVGQLDS